MWAIICLGLLFVLAVAIIVKQENEIEKLHRELELIKEHKFLATGEEK